MSPFGRGFALVTTLLLCGSAPRAHGSQGFVSACRELWQAAFSSPGLRVARQQLDALSRRDHSLKELEPLLRNLASLPEVDRRHLAETARSYKNLRSQVGVFAFDRPGASPGIATRRPTPQKNYRALQDGFPVSPRRSVDLALRALLQPETHFAAQLAAGKKPLEAWRNTLAYWRPTKTTEYSAYDVDGVLAVARDLQEAWKQGSSPPGANDMLHLAGSFPNGRAQFPKSDVDLRPILPDSLEIDHGELQTALHRSFAKHLPLLGAPRLQFPPISLERMGFTNPFMVRIRPDSIELLVWPRPGFPWVDIGYARHPKLPAPLAYKLE